MSLFAKWETKQFLRQHMKRALDCVGEMALGVVQIFLLNSFGRYLGTIKTKIKSHPIAFVAAQPLK